MSNSATVLPANPTVAIRLPELSKARPSPSPSVPVPVMVFTRHVGATHVFPVGRSHRNVVVPPLEPVSSTTSPFWKVGGRAWAGVTARPTSMIKATEAKRASLNLDVRIVAQSIEEDITRAQSKSMPMNFKFMSVSKADEFQIHVRFEGWSGGRCSHSSPIFPDTALWTGLTLGSRPPFGLGSFGQSRGRRHLTAIQNPLQTQIASPDLGIFSHPLLQPASQGLRESQPRRRDGKRR